MCNSKKVEGKIQGVHLETVAGVLLTQKFLSKVDFGDKTEQDGAGDARKGRDN
jgi:hypothetical protein